MSRIYHEHFKNIQDIISKHTFWRNSIGIVSLKKNEEVCIAHYDDGTLVVGITNGECVEYGE